MESNTYISLPTTYSLAHYKLYNNLGQVVDKNTITPTSNQILRGNKPPGIYILNIIDSKGNLIAKQKLLIK
jgi:DNA-binding beta-propeller fold protein YncE